MSKSRIFYAAMLASLAGALSTAPANATPPIAIAGAAAVAEANGEGGAGGAGGTSNSRTGGSNTYGGALGQAQSALSAGGICGKDTKFVFGVLQWSDYSSKCFNYHMEMIAAESGDWELANQWVKRADGM